MYIFMYMCIYIYIYIYITAEVSVSIFVTQLISNSLHEYSLIIGYIASQSSKYISKTLDHCP